MWKLDLVSLLFLQMKKIIREFRSFCGSIDSKKRYLSMTKSSSPAALKLPSSTALQNVASRSGKLTAKRVIIVKMLKRDGQIFEAAEIKEADCVSILPNKPSFSLDFAPKAFDHLLIKSGLSF